MRDPWRILFPLLGLAAACGGSDPPPTPDIHGTYTISTTNGQGACLPGWTPGQTASNISVDVTQSGGSVTATVTGVSSAVLIGLWGQGANVYQGTVSGSSLDLVAHGTRSYSSGSCAFTVDATLHATVSGDVMQGTIVYTPNTNSSPDCASVRTCSASQSFNGTRPPTS